MQLSNDLQRVLYNYTPSNILFMAAPRSRCGHYIFALWFLSSTGSRPSDHHFRSVCWFVCLFDCAEFFSAVFDPISIKLGHMLYVWV